MGMPLLCGLASGPTCFVGLVSFLGLASGPACFVGLASYLGPGERACEPYFSNPITIYTCLLEICNGDQHNSVYR